MEVNYFRDIDSDAIYACVGPMGGNAIFRLMASDTRWEFLVPNSPTWDAAHQRIYRNSRVEAARLDEFPTALPPLPEIPQGPFADWRDYFLPRRPIRAWRYPSLAKFLKARNQETVTVFVVLDEDIYEAAFGDGEFHYFRDVFLSREDAQRYMDQNQTEWHRFHLRTMAIKLEHRVFVFPDFQPELFDHYEAKEVLTALQARFRGRWLWGLWGKKGVTH
jgi:hypothetical protein